VIYMGVARAASLQSALLAAGMTADMPVAVIANATRPEEAALLTRLSTMERVLREAGIASPAIIVAGEVAALASLPVNRSWRARPAGASC
jgi:siroheme synthase